MSKLLTSVLRCGVYIWGDHWQENLRGVGSTALGKPADHQCRSRTATQWINVDHQPERS